jgi:hypothetical protein
LSFDSAFEHPAPGGQSKNADSLRAQAVMRTMVTLLANKGECDGLENGAQQPSVPRSALELRISCHGVDAAAGCRSSAALVLADEPTGNHG